MQVGIFIYQPYLGVHKVKKSREIPYYDCLRMFNASCILHFSHVIKMHIGISTKDKWKMYKMNKMKKDACFTPTSDAEQGIGDG